MRKNRLVGVAYSEPIANWGGAKSRYPVYVRE